MCKYSRFVCIDKKKKEKKMLYFLENVNYKFIGLIGKMILYLILGKIVDKF